MKRLILPFFIGAALMLFSCGKTSPHAIIETDFGEIKIKLFESTPRHTDHFVQLAKEGYYDDLAFHRVIQGFMIQGGDPRTRSTPPKSPSHSSEPPTFDHEIGEYHYRGTFSAARTNNPAKKSGSQFYIVDGAPVTDQMLDGIEHTQGFKYTAAERALYKQVGGAPHLDGDYTAYGEVVSGMEVVDKIAAAPKNGSSPIDDIRMKIKIVYE